jgi:predicted metalloenzyme YecM
MPDLFEAIIGDYRGFAAQQRDRLAARGIDISAYGLSHLAYRVPEWDQYLRVRGQLERLAIASRENFWNGRPISLIVPREPLEVLGGKLVPLIELIPPVHQRVYKMGLEHLGVVVGEDAFEEFVEKNKPVLTGQQFQGPTSTPDPVYILMEDFTHVKFYRLSLKESVEVDGTKFDGFHHVEGWVPQRLVTATGPNPLPR